MRRSSVSSLLRPQVGVIHDDRNRRKALGKPADVVWVGISRGTVACHRASVLLSYRKVRVECRVVGAIPVHGGVELQPNRAGTQASPQLVKSGLARPHPYEGENLRSRAV